MSYRLITVAETGGELVDFRPYVASIDGDGTVAFQAATATGDSAIFTGTGERLARVPLPATARVCSHPDIAAGAISTYVDEPAGAAVLRIDPDGAVTRIAATDGSMASIGPLGPTMNQRGLVAFRADSAGGRHGVFVGAGGSPTLVGETGDRFRAFDGLPVVTPGGAVVMRASMTGGGEAIVCWRDGQLTFIGETGAELDDIGRFPAVDGDRAVGFAGQRAGGGLAIFVAAAGQLTTVVDDSGPFASFRGVLIEAAGHPVFYATPRGGDLGIYCGPDPVGDRLLGIGDQVAGTVISAFALNPVSINRRGQLAIRVELADGRQQILRADPARPIPDDSSAS